MAACPHCGAENAEGSSFCQKCGKALPAAGPSAPRVVSGDAIAATALGRNVQAVQLRKQAGRAFVALLAVAILTALGALLFIFAISRLQGVDASVLRTLGIVNLMLAVIYGCLAFWARANPLPAAIVGLVLFVSIHVLNAILDPATIPQGWLVKIIIIVALVKAMQAGLKYRQLVTQARASGEAL